MAPQPKKPVISYVDVPELPETFVDSVRHFIFDGHTLRIEFTVTRLDNAAVAGKRVPRCRLVLSRPGIIDLLNQMVELRKVMIERKIIVPGAPSDESPVKPIQ
jgi:hypothetical protein